MFDTVVRDDLHRRLKALTPDRKPGWGKFTAPKMVCHLTDGLRMTLGDLAVKSRRTPLRFPIVKQLVVYVLPFPKGELTAPELLARAPTAWNGEIEALGAMIDRTFASSEFDSEAPVLEQVKTELVDIGESSYPVARRRARVQGDDAADTPLRLVLRCDAEPGSRTLR